MDIKDGKHLVFLLGGDNYGIPILDVSEINGLMPITSLPKAPMYFKGVVNLRGKVIPVIDLRLKLGMPEKEYDEETCIIIVNLYGDKQVGLIVDTVSEVFDIPMSEIEPPPNYGEQSGDNSLINGIGKAKDKLVILVNTNNIVSKQEIMELS